MARGANRYQLTANLSSRFSLTATQHCLQMTDENQESSLPGALVRLTAFIENGWLGQLKPTTAKVWIVFNKFSDNLTGECNPSLSRIAWEALRQRDPENARKAKRELIALGLLEVLSVGGGFHTDTTVVRVCVPATPPVNLTPRQFHGGSISPSVDSTGNPPWISPVTPRGFGGPNSHELLKELPRERTRALSGEAEAGKAAGKDKKSKQPPVPMPDVPETLKTPQFEIAWSQFSDHRRAIRKELTALAAKIILQKLEAMGPAVAVTALENSIANSWTGVFEPDTRNGTLKEDPKVRTARILAMGEQRQQQSNNKKSTRWAS